MLVCFRSKLVDLSNRSEQYVYATQRRGISKLIGQMNPSTERRRYGVTPPEMVEIDMKILRRISPTLKQQEFFVADEVLDRGQFVPRY
jgi:hypothetical protein